LSDRWIDLGTQRRVTLTNLDAGDHLLEVRAANADSVWSDPPLRLNIHRNPAPWRSPWAYAAYAFIVLLLIVYRVRMHRANIQRIVSAQKRLESEVALRTRELVESNRQLAEAGQAKSSFLARGSSACAAQGIANELAANNNPERTAFMEAFPKESSRET